MGLIFILNLLQFNEIDQAYGPFTGKVVMGAFVVGFVEYLNWHNFFNGLRDGSRIFAGFIGIFIVLFGLLVPSIISDLYDKPLNENIWYFFLYIGLSHLLFAFFSKQG